MRLLAPLLLALGCAGAPLFSSRVAQAPLVEKLRASGGDSSRILHPRSAADLAALASGKRYKFIVDADGRLAVAPLPADAPGNEYVHPILAAGRPVRTAGGLTVEREGDRVVRVVVDQDSKAYCPTLPSLAAAEDALAAIGVPRAAVARADRPPVCAAAK